MDYGTVLFISYPIQIALAFYAWKKLPRVGNIPQTAENSRNAAIWTAVLPCAFLIPIMQVTWILYYMARVKVGQGKQVSLPTSFDNTKQDRQTGGGANPFGGANATPTTSANPFGTSGGSTTPGANPFGDEGSNGDRGNQPNPFA
jgi:hypothetical protein